MASGLHYKSLADLPPGMRRQVAGKVMAKAAMANPVAGQRKTSTRLIRRRVGKQNDMGRV